MQNLKPLASLYNWVSQFESTLIGNLEDRFSHDVAQIIVACFYDVGQYSICLLSKHVLNIQPYPAMRYYLCYFLLL